MKKNQFKEKHRKNPPSQTELNQLTYDLIYEIKITPRKEK
jgi:hypothetical protein